MVVILLLAISGGLLLIGLRLWKIIFWKEKSTPRAYWFLPATVEQEDRERIFEEWYERASLTLDER